MPFYNHSLGAKPQRGAALLVALVVLTAMTILGFSSLKNSDLQQSIIKNTQFLMYARAAAKSEINAQVDIINTSVTDDVIQDLLDVGVGGGDLDTTSVNLNLTAVQSAFQQNITMQTTCTNCSRDGSSMGQGSIEIVSLRANIISAATLTGTAATSTQTQGFWYLIPGN